MRQNKIKNSSSDRVLYAIVDVLLILILLVVAYPIIYVISCSFSSASAVSSGQVLLWPVQPSVDGYKLVFSYKTVWTGLKNSLFYTIVGTTFNMILTTLAAYPLSRPHFQGKAVYTGLFLFTMIFTAGMIPKYILMSKLHLINTRWALVLSGGISVYNMIIVRTYFRSSIPAELYEAAHLDGCSEWQCFLNIALPLAKSVLSVITLYYAVAHWNSYFNAMLYVRESSLQPLQLVLRNILIASRVDLTQITDSELLERAAGMTDLLKYALIVITSIPVIAIYPLVQKYFEKGVMIGSVKG
ncbi:MAG: carbohydrate ABC transporter permease [Clostridia bacterium]|nr:carbohydrate ABC transporter permease [Clostridia bacterium]